MQGKIKKQQNGFTLIELLVVIAIIVLLISILLPALKYAKELAAQTACMCKIRTNVAGAGMYSIEHHRYAPCGYYSPGGRLGYTRIGPWFHADLMGPYIGLDNMTEKYPAPLGPVLCPSRPIDNTRAWIGYNGSMSEIAHSALRDNEGVNYGEADSLGFTSHNPYAVGPLLQDVTGKPEAIVLFEDSRGQGFRYVSIYSHYLGDGNFWPPAGFSDGSLPDFRHNGGVNYGFMDGHVGSLSSVEDTVDALQDGKVTWDYR